MDYAKILKDIAIELVEDKEHLEVREMPSLEENVVVLHVLLQLKMILLD